MTYLHEHAQPFRHESSGKDVAVLLHGWTGSPAHFRLLGDHLAGSGIGVVAPAFAGHATSIDEMANTGWKDWVRGAIEAASEAGSGGKRVHIVGLSMGGVIGLLAAPTVGAASLTTINAPQRVHRRMARTMSVVGRVKKIHAWEPAEPPADEAGDYWHQYGAAPTRSIADLLLLVRASRRNLHRVTMPTLVVQSRADETVHPSSGQNIYDGIAATDKELLWLHSSRHVATLDHERHLIDEAVLSHIERTGRLK